MITGIGTPSSHNRTPRIASSFSVIAIACDRQIGLRILPSPTLPERVWPPALGRLGQLCCSRARLRIHIEQLAQRLAAAEQARPDGPDRDAQDARGFVVTHA